MIRPLALSQTRYEMRAGEARRLAGTRQALDFILKAKRLRIGIDGEDAKGFVVGPGIKGDEPLLAASHTVKPGEYTLTLSVTSDSGEERVIKLSVVLNPVERVPSTAAKPPVVLLNGWQFGFLNGGCPISSGPSDTFGNLAEYLAGDGVPVVYFFDNCAECPSCKIEDLGNTLQQFLNLIQYDNGGLVPQVDVVTHSMGGLIVRAYLAGLQADGSLRPPPNPRVGKLVLIAEPNFGSFIAPNIGTQTAEMIPGSSLLWQLATWNQGGDDLRGVNALAIIGNAGAWSGRMNASDGVVSLTSGSIGFARDPSRTRILPYCHIDPGPLISLFMDCSTAPGIAQVDSAMHPTWVIIQSFLAGTSDWTSIGATPGVDPYLSQYGGLYFSQENAADKFLTDLSQVLFGNAKLEDRGTTGTVFYDEFAAGTATFQATSSSLGQSNIGPVTVLTGRFLAVRAKSAPAISSVTPLLSTIPLLVQSGTAITINGSGFGQQQCHTCAVSAYPGPSSFQVSSWSDQTITGNLPSSYNGLVQLVVQTASGQDQINIMATPVTISAVVNGASFLPDIASGTWITIQGSGLSSTTRTWTTADFQGTQLPTHMDGVSVTVNGKPAYLYYISRTQLNVLVPDDPITGQVQVQVTSPLGISNPLMANKNAFSPAFFRFLPTKYVAAVHTSGVYVGPAGLIPIAPFSPAKPGETIMVYGTGFGATNPLLPSGQIVAKPARLADSVTILIGGKRADVSFAGLTASGEDQFNVTVPADLPDGDQPFIATIDGMQSQTGVFLAVQK
ncbi:MAG: IPT/TIG domain-containing protein [Acidobacteriia bacterium]|nr:IPT/TIG domain-containing protein [Terriglobia bacterium]